jgi:hypothetical protein
VLRSPLIRRPYEPGRQSRLGLQHRCWQLMCCSSSAGRGNKAAPLLTGPGRTSKSSAGDSYPRGQIAIRQAPPPRFRDDGIPARWGARPKPILARVRAREHRRVDVPYCTPSPQATVACDSLPRDTASTNHVQKDTNLHPWMVTVSGVILEPQATTPRREVQLEAFLTPNPATQGTWHKCTVTASKTQRTGWTKAQLESSKPISLRQLNVPLVRRP